MAIRIYNNKTVYDEALDRIRWIFDEFKNVSVNFSGGKDSTVIFNLSMIVAKEKNRLPLQVNFLDQEGEWTDTIDYVKKIMYMSDVIPRWYQIEFDLLNASSFENKWFRCWDEREKEKWLREKDPISIKKLDGCNRFIEFFSALSKNDHPNEKCVKIAGVRGEESPRRMLGLTNYATYKWATWGKVEDKKLGHYTLYPIYDWSYIDVWKAIHDNNWEYNKIYDSQYRYGIPIQYMRVSSLFHETSIRSLFYLQEVDKELYNKLTHRMKGIDSACKFGNDDYFVKKLPFMFKNWQEYRDYLLEKLVSDKKLKMNYKNIFARQDKKFYNDLERNARTHINSILSNDVDYTKLKNYARGMSLIYKGKNGKDKKSD